MEEVITPKYKPSSKAEMLLFREKQKFMTAVFDKTLKTDKGKAIVRQYHGTSNAQKMYEELQEHHLTSTKAEAEAESLLRYLITSQVDDGKWRGDTHSYILHWEKQVEDYNHKSAEKIGETQQKMYLEQAVKGISQLAIVKTTARTVAKQTKIDVNYTMYADLLKGAAMQYDLTVDKTNPHEKRRAKRTAYSHDIMQTEDDFFDTFQDEDIFHDVDTTIYELNYGQTVPTRLPRDSWFGLTRNDQNAWKNISEEGKASILKLLKSKSEKYSATHYPIGRLEWTVQNNYTGSKFSKRFFFLAHIPLF